MSLLGFTESANKLQRKRKSPWSLGDKAKVHTVRKARGYKVQARSRERREEIGKRRETECWEGREWRKL